MKIFVCFCFLIYLSAAVSFGQSLSGTEEVMPSVEDMIKSLSGDKASEASMADSIEDIVDTMTKQMQRRPVTEDMVKSAIEGTLVTEETAPTVNLESVEAIDAKTQRYSPRLKLDFGEFPLRRISGNFSGTVKDDGVEELEQTNTSLTNEIVRRIQNRLKLETVRFEFKNRTARLTGSVSTQRQRELIEVMLRMEPGIDMVKNELVVEKK